MGIKLRDITVHDAQFVYNWKQDPYLKVMALNYDFSTTLEEQEKDIKQALDSDYSEYKIIEHDEKPIGYIRIDFIDHSKHFAWLRFALGEERGYGYSKEALQLYIEDLFSRSCMRIEGEVYEHNIPSQKILESSGFIREGIKRNAHYDGEKFINVFVYGLVK